MSSLPAGLGFEVEYRLLLCQRQAVPKLHQLGAVCNENKVYKSGQRPVCPWKMGCTAQCPNILNAFSIHQPQAAAAARSPGMAPALLPPPLPLPQPCALCPRCTARQRRWLTMERNSVRQRGHLWVASRLATGVGLTRAPRAPEPGKTGLQAGQEVTRSAELWGLPA